jgi:hypothetical protein
LTAFSYLAISIVCGFMAAFMGVYLIRNKHFSKYIQNKKEDA